MNRKKAYQLFEEMIELAVKELQSFTNIHEMRISHKADKSIVTECDYYIDKVLTEFAISKGLAVVSEEGTKKKQTIASGNYLTIDPIDGSLGYIDYVNYAFEHGGENLFLSKELACF